MALELFRLEKSERKTMDSVNKNQLHFSSEHAALYDNEVSFALGKAIADNILAFSKKVKPQPETGSEVLGKDTRVLDFACGTGIISQVSIYCDSG